MGAKKSYKSSVLINSKRYIWDGKFYENTSSLNRVINIWENKGYLVSFKIVQHNNSKLGNRKYGFILYKYKKRR
jgi:hypothetical protein